MADENLKICPFTIIGAAFRDGAYESPCSDLCALHVDGKGCAIKIIAEGFAGNVNAGERIRGTYKPLGLFDEIQ